MQDYIRAYKSNTKTINIAILSPHLFVISNCSQKYKLDHNLFQINIAVYILTYHIYIEQLWSCRIGRKINSHILRIDNFHSE